ncbi:MAG: PhnD/SsuA/transferrin family substrate-binding protein [Xanthomonadaceae bacterium]|nr:PhnD/SsuA/transferrin family substrate-binding protein [Xanthomonadaceae bacterium]
MPEPSSPGLIPIKYIVMDFQRSVCSFRDGMCYCSWTCGFPYVRHRPALQLVAVPRFQGAPLYRSYLITSVHNRDIQSWLDLRGKTFAYSDPDSNSGFLYPQFAMQEQGVEPYKWFRRGFFTWSHRNVVEAVASGLADAGAVDGYVWETLTQIHPELTSQTRVVLKSPEFGHPPIVAGTRYEPEALANVQRALLDMERSPEGQHLLQTLNLDGFIPGDASLYDSVEHMMMAVKPHPRP